MDSYLVMSRSSGAPQDPDITALAAAIAANGGAFPGAQQTAFNAAMVKMKAAQPGLRAKIKELWCPAGADGDLNAAAVKTINGATSPTVTLTNFLTTDYTVAFGVWTQAGNSTKRVITDFSPAVNGSLATGEWGMSYYGTKMQGSGVAFGSAANANSFVSNAGTQGKIAGLVVSLQPTNAPAGEQGANLRLSSMQVTGGVATAYTGGWAHNTAAGSAVAQTGGLSVFSTNSSFFTSAATSGYAVHAPLTPAELRALQTFFDDACEGIGRTIFSNSTLVVVGDSYTANPPTGPTSASTGWCALVAAAKGLTYDATLNNGIAGRGWGPPCNGGYMSDGNRGRDAFFKGVLQAPTKRFIPALGLNDVYQTGTNAAVNASQIAMFDFLAAVGYPPQYVAVATDYWSSGVADQTLAAAIHDTTVANAAAYGYHLIDFFHGLTADPAVGGQAPSLAVAQSYENAIVHKNDAGHLKLRDDVVTAMTGVWW